LQITNIKIHEHSSHQIRITFNWPLGLQEVYINAKLFTLQEYKRLGGYITKKMPGETVYSICTPEGRPTSATFICKTDIVFALAEKMGWGYDSGYKSYELTFKANYPVPENIVCYVIKKNSLPRDISDGTLYYWSEPLAQNTPTSGIVRTKKDEFIQIFVKDEEYYGVIQA